MARALEVDGERWTLSNHGQGVEISYQLTDAGQALAPLMGERATRSTNWHRRGLRPEHLDPATLLWDIHRRIDQDTAPKRRVTVGFEFSDRSSTDRQMWLVLNRGRAELCRTDGGYETDLAIHTDTETLSRWWLKDLDWATATKQQTIRSTGPRELARDFPNWFLGYALSSKQDSGAS